MQEFACKYFHCKAIGKLRKRTVNSTRRIAIAHPKLRAKSNSALHPKYCLDHLVLHHPWHSKLGWGENINSVASVTHHGNHLLQNIRLVSSIRAALLNYVPDDANDVLLSKDDV